MIVRNNEEALAKLDLCDRRAPQGRFIQTFLGRIHKKHVSSLVSRSCTANTLHTSLLHSQECALLYMSIQHSLSDLHGKESLGSKRSYIANHSDTDKEIEHGHRLNSQAPFK